MYGGFGIALAAVLIYASTKPDLAHGVYLDIAMAFLGMALGRVVALSIERDGFWPWCFVPMEMGLAALLIYPIVWP